MSPAHVVLALLVALAWGLNFAAVAVGLHTVPPLLLLALRFVLAALPIVVLPRPAVSWARLTAISTSLFILQFAFLFTAMARGMSAGMASVVLQAQALFTPIVAAVVLREPPTARQVAGIAVALLGMGVVGSTIAGGGITVIGVGLTLVAALSWSVGNILLRGAGPQNMLAMIVWMSVIPPLPLFALSLLLEGGPHEMIHALTTMGWSGAGSILYTAIGSTLFGYGLWAYLLKHYRATTVAPFALLVPIFAAASASLLLGEQFGQTRLLGMGIVLAGLAVIVMPARWTTVVPLEVSEQEL
ncbi:MAG: EamA family transporter [Rhodospirillaceae bacterium]|nr:MAG: EamA family transporter [Rhodospirillaceae bacterium]